MAVTFDKMHHAALMIVRFEEWKEETGKDSFLEFLQHSNYEPQLAFEIIADCARAYRRAVYTPPTPPT